MKRLLSLFFVICLFTAAVFPASADTGYTVTMGADQTAVKGETVAVPVVIGHSGGMSTFNAVDMTFTYDTAKLELTTASLSGFSLTKEAGKVRVMGYGQDRECGGTAFVLTFKTLATGRTEVKVTSAKVDSSNHAVSADAPQASLTDNATQITIGLKSDTSSSGGGHVPGAGGGSGGGGAGQAGTPVTEADFDGLWVLPYVELDGSTVFLTAIAGDPGKDSTYAFDGVPMYYTAKYTGKNAAIGQKVYLALTIAGPGEPVINSEIAGRISLVKEKSQTIAYEKDVNGSGSTDLTDVRLIYDIYNGQFAGFDDLSVERFLHADLNLDGRVNVEDAAALMDVIEMGGVR